MKILKPSKAVETTTPGFWGNQCNSLISFWPIWTNNNWAGISFNLSASPFCLEGNSSSSNSTERSHRVNWSSAPEAAKQDESVGCHSIEVIGAVCHEKEATGVGAGAFVL